MSPGRAVRRGCAARLVIALSLLTAPLAAAADPYTEYRAAHAEVDEEDLLDVHGGEPLDRVLAVLHHPDAGYEPRAVALLRADLPGAVEVPTAEALASDAALPPLVGAVVQRCGSRPARAHEGSPRFDSWFLLRDGALQAWSLQSYGPDCRPDEPSFEASDHDAMRLVGAKLFARAREGAFRYGALRYEAWDEAFASPTRQGMLSRLQSAAEARPHDAHAQNRLGVGLYAAGHRKEAVAALERAARLAPGWPTPYRNLAVAHRQRGDLAAASRADERAEAAARAPAF